MQIRSMLVATSCAPLLAGSSAFAQCTTWLPSPPNPGGVVTSLASWDPDGPGPAAAVLVAGLETAGVVTWDGQAWSPLPGFADGITALTVHNSELIAAAGPTVNRVARWTGSTWSDLGGPGMLASVTALADDPSGALIAAMVPGPAAMWDGTTWVLMDYYPNQLGLG